MDKLIGKVLNERYIIKDVIVNCLENLMINRIIEKDKKQLEVRMQEKQIKNDKLGNIYKYIRYIDIPKT